MTSRRYAIATATYIVVLLLTQSVMGLGIDKFKELWGVGALEVVAYLIVGVGAAGVLWVGGTVWGRCTVPERAWVGLALAVYSAGVLNARNPQERLHYLGYGLLAIILYVGVARDRRGGGVWIPATVAFAVGTAVGLTDELLQILWPRRYFDWVDVAMNAVAVALGLLVAIPMWNALQRSPE